MNAPRNTRRLPSVAALLIVLLAVVAALRWTAAHPTPFWWDEANYFNQVFDDRGAYVRSGLIGSAKALVFADPVRPPAYRGAVLPLVMTGLPPLAWLRLVSLLTTVAAMALLARAATAVASGSSAMLAAAFILAMPCVLTAGAWFGTEYPLFLAVALLLASLLHQWRLGLAAALAFGFLSKMTFGFIAAPAVLVALLTATGWRERRNLLLSSAAGAFVAAGWWFWNAIPAFRFAQVGRTDVRAAVGSVFSWQTALQKARVFGGEALGYGVAVAMILIVATTLALRGRTIAEPWTPSRRRALIIAVASSVPLILLMALSPAFGPRIFAPALLPLAIALAMFLDRVPATVRAAGATLVLLQVLSLAAAPERFLPVVEQTDWSRLRALVPGPAPHIAYLGNWGSLSPPEIRYGWTRSGHDATVKWLWRFEEGAIDWRKVEPAALASDAVLVVPPSTAGADNRYNAELIHRLEASHGFCPPLPITIATRDPIELLLYRRAGGSPGDPRHRSHR